MSGKSYELYAMMLNNLKECAAEVGLVLKPKIISCDFEKGAIKAFKLAFPGVKIQGCHFQGKEKKQTNSQRVKDSEIAVLKLKYKHGELEVMDYLMKVSVYSKNYD